MNIRHEFRNIWYNICHEWSESSIPDSYLLMVTSKQTLYWNRTGTFSTNLKVETHIHAYTYTDLHKLYTLQGCVWKQACVIVFFFFRRDLSPASLFICVFYLVFSIIIEVLPSKLPWCNPTVIPNIKEPHVSQTHTHPSKSFAMFVWLKRASDLFWGKMSFVSKHC